jgi:hypothetical protein
MAFTTLMTGTADATMRITEWAYQGAGGEFIEFTNVGAAAVDMTGWSFDDSSAVAGTFSLSDFGVVAPRESVILSENTAAAFRTEWGLAGTVNVIGENSQNLGRGDEMNLYDNTSALVDTLTYDDQGIAGSIRTNVNSGNPATLAALGANDVLQWVLSSAGDGYGSYASVGGALGNPGKFTLVPEPNSGLLFVAGILGLIGLGTRRAFRAARIELA